MSADLSAIRDDLAAAMERLRAIEARLADLGGGAEAVDREWPPVAVDPRDPYWQWMDLEQASSPKGPYGRTKLHEKRHDVSVRIGRHRWYSLRRIWQTHVPD